MKITQVTGPTIEPAVPFETSQMRSRVIGFLMLKVIGIQTYGEVR